jgi:hypothetical protein
MKNLLLLLALPVSFSVNAQYYYKDILGALETSREMRTYLANKVLSVNAAGFDPQGMKTTDFAEQKDVLQNGIALRTTTRNNLNTTILFSRFDNQTRLASVTDSTGDVKSISTYSYDAGGKIISIKNSTDDKGDEINQTEIHQWFYNSAGQPQKMLRVVNEKDSTEYRFNTDEKGNVIDEQSFRKGIAGEMIYYYYDADNRLTDIVRYNEKLKKLLPDYMFEYDDSNRVIQKVTLLSNLHLGYLIWRYVYNDKGLKTKEALFNKDKEMTGKIEYSYTFAQ